MGTQYMTVSLTMSMTRILSTFIIILSVSGLLAQDGDVPSCQPGDLFLPDPDDCDSYYMCNAAGEAVAMDCPEGLYFDIDHLTATGRRTWTASMTLPRPWSAW